MREESRRLFCDFWEEPAESLRRTRDGIYTAVTLGPPGKRLQILLPDLRFNRTATVRMDLAGRSYEDWARTYAEAGREVPGYYLPNPAHEATMLGEPQWRWLEQTLGEAADLRVFASSLQVLADRSGWEAWINFGRDHQRLIDVLRRSGAEGFFCISGDTHYAELSRLDVNVPYPLWDLTSSGLTEVWPVRTPNANRVSEVLREQNFGLIDIDWMQGPRITLQVRDVSGRVRIEHALDAHELRVRG
jgi:alkaline phosphatase D